MSKLELHNNSYKCYDSIPTPPDGFEQANEYKDHSTTTSVKNSLIRSPSLDSLINSSEQDSSLEDELSDSDSLCELQNISSCDAISFDKPRTSDIEQLKNVEPAKEPARKAYLEKSHKSCDYENCGFKEDSSKSGQSASSNNENSASISEVSSRPISQPVALKINRRNSVVNLDSRMETIHEDPNESKILSVKEILARFETLRETAEVN